MIRTLSHSEIRRALTCPAQWDFSYSDRLAGSSLRSKTIAPLLSEGRAFGASAAAWHVALEGEPVLAALDASLDADADEQREHGVHDQEAHDAMRERLLKLVGHYMNTVPAFGVDPVVERELLVSIPSRTGRQASSRYKFLGYVDAVEYDPLMGRTWLVEFKLRRQLTPVALIQLDRQIRWYSWAYWQATGTKPAGVKVVERWNQVPLPARILKSGRPSHAKDQLTTDEAYLSACSEYEEPVDGDTLAAIERRRWQQIVPIMFREGELEEAGRELVAAAQIIGALDRGEIMPIRNPSRANCGGCAFKEICPAPDDGLVDELFERRPAKRDRVDEVPESAGKPSDEAVPA